MVLIVKTEATALKSRPINILKLKVVKTKKDETKETVKKLSRPRISEESRYIHSGLIEKLGPGTNMKHASKG